MAGLTFDGLSVTIDHREIVRELRLEGFAGYLRELSGWSTPLY